MKGCVISIAKARKTTYLRYRLILINIITNNLKLIGKRYKKLAEINQNRYNNARIDVQ